MANIKWNLSHDDEGDDEDPREPEESNEPGDAQAQAVAETLIRLSSLIAKQLLHGQPRAEIVAALTQCDVAPETANSFVNLLAKALRRTIENERFAGRRRVAGIAGCAAALVVIAGSWVRMVDRWGDDYLWAAALAGWFAGGCVAWASSPARGRAVRSLAVLAAVGGILLGKLTCFGALRGGWDYFHLATAALLALPFGRSRLPR